MITYKHAFLPFFYSEGVRELAEKRGAFWLIDLIASHYTDKKLIKALRKDSRLRDLAIWSMTPKPNDGMAVECRVDTGEPIVTKQDVPSTDFFEGDETASSFKLFCSIVKVGESTGPRLFLPSEY